MILLTPKITIYYNYWKIKHIIKNCLEPYNLANFNVMQVKILKQFLSKNLFLKENFLKNVKDFSELRNE